jgi:hypothetical protein
MAGLPALGEDTVQLDDGVTGFVRGGQLVGAAGWDKPRAMLHWTAELERRLPVPERLPVDTIPEPEPVFSEEEWLTVG